MYWKEGLLKQDALLYCHVKTALRDKPPSGAGCGLTEGKDEVQGHLVSVL